MISSGGQSERHVDAGRRVLVPNGSRHGNGKFTKAVSKKLHVAEDEVEDEADSRRRGGGEERSSTM